MKLWIYETHIFELRNEEISVKKILAVINATYAVAKRKPEKIRLARIRTLTSAIPVQRSNQACQLPVGLLAQLVRALQILVFLTFNCLTILSNFSQFMLDVV